MSYRKLFYVSNVLLLVVFAWAFAEDFFAEWRPYQKNYYRMSAEALEKKAGEAKDEKKAAELRAEAKKFRKAPVEIKQIIVADLNRYDRCITCHVGMDEYTNPTLKNEFTEHPYKAHPQVDGPLVKAHSFQKLGCTVCHSGQGLATTKDAAHGWVKHWEKPLLKGVHVQASCVKCHGNFETLKGAEAAALGRKTFVKHGCYGCHSIDGWGQSVSVDLGAMADKPFELIAGYNFKKIRIDGKELPHDHHHNAWNIQNWILGHLVNDPQNVTPNDPLAKYNAEPIAPSAMPDFTKEITREQADAVTAYLSGLTKKELIPHKYYVPAKPKPEPSFASAKEHGKFVYEKYGCQGCHGLEAKQGRRRFNALGPGQAPLEQVKGDPKRLVEEMSKGMEPTLPDLVGTYTHEELVKKISHGVPAHDVKLYNPAGPAPAAYMPAWKDKISKKEMDALATWLLSIAKADDSGF